MIDYADFVAELKASDLRATRVAEANAPAQLESNLVHYINSGIRSIYSSLPMLIQVTSVDLIENTSIYVLSVSEVVERIVAIRAKKEDNTLVPVSFDSVSSGSFYLMPEVVEALIEEDLAELEVWYSYEPVSIVENDPINLPLGLKNALKYYVAFEYFQHFNDGDSINKSNVLYAKYSNEIANIIATNKYIVNIPAYDVKFKNKGFI